MPFPIQIPRAEGDPLNHTLDAGDILFVLGANGTGKSSLMQRINQGANTWWISAHRQTWFTSNAVEMSLAQKVRTEKNVRSISRKIQSRWMDSYAGERASLAIFDLIDAENVRALGIASAVDQGNIHLAQELSKVDAPIVKINELLKLSNIPIEISVHENSRILASKRGSTPYSIAELSDGERNALLIAASVLTVKSGTLLLIDEPERHLHRSIISPLLTLLFNQRLDCAFVVSTHDIMLPLDNPLSKTLLIRSCAYQGQQVSNWEVDLLDSVEGLSVDIKKDILGARREIIFVEGTENSLDIPLYSLVFPGVSVVPKGSCKDVEHAVGGIREAEELHWVKAWGIVDNDRREQEEIDTLRANHVFALSVFSVEAVYYHPHIQKLLAIRQSDVTGMDADNACNEAVEATVHAIRQHTERLAGRTAERTVRKAFFANLPNGRDITADAAPVDVQIDIAAIVNEELTRLQAALDNQNIETLISYYPVRETPALDGIVRQLGFKNRDQYEGAVLKLLEDDEGALTFVRGLFGGLHEALTEQ